jgi:hypothetical protein
MLAWRCDNPPKRTNHCSFPNFPEETLAPDNIGSYSMPLEVYLQSGIVRGILVTNQDRLSNYLILREGEEVFSLREAQLTDLRGKTIEVNADQFLIYMHQVFAIADLSPQFRADRSGLEPLYIRKDQSRVLVVIAPCASMIEELTGSLVIRQSCGAPGQGNSKTRRMRLCRVEANPMAPASHRFSIPAVLCFKRRSLMTRLRVSG